MTDEKDTIASHHPKGQVPSETDGKTDGGRVPVDRVTEYGGPKGPEPTRYDDWERGGRCIDF